MHTVESYEDELILIFIVWYTWMGKWIDYIEHSHTRCTQSFVCTHNITNDLLKASSRSDCCMSYEPTDGVVLDPLEALNLIWKHWGKSRCLISHHCCKHSMQNYKLSTTADATGAHTEGSERGIFLHFRIEWPLTFL